MCFRYMGALPEEVDGPHCTSSTMSSAECRTKGTSARSDGVKRAMPSPPDREVPKSWVKRGTSSGERMEKVYDILARVRIVSLDQHPDDSIAHSVSYRQAGRFFLAVVDAVVAPALLHNELPR